MAAIRAVFFAECEEQLAALEGGLMALEAGGAEADTLNAVFRAVHSIKGGAGAFGLEALVRFAHVFETALEALRAGFVAAEAWVVAVLLRAADVLADVVRAACDGSPADELALEGLGAELGRLCGGAVLEAGGVAGLDFTPVRVALEVSPALCPAPDWVIRFAPAAALYANGNDAALLLRELGRLGPAVVRLAAEGLPAFEVLDPAAAYLAWTVRLPGTVAEARIREVFEFVVDECRLSIVAGAAVARVRGAEVSKPTLRVDLQRVDRLVDLVGELVINEAMVSQLVAEAGAGRRAGVVAALDELGQLTRDIQDGVMAIRAQPVRGVFQRMPRLVRELAVATGKSVRLVSEGEDTEVDTTVIELLADPLTHMIRNAVDHGIEVTDVRARRGKPAQGTVWLSAAHRAGRIVIEVADDGAGIDRGRVRDKAVGRGLVSAAAVLSEEEIDALIFLPGFTTAAAVSDISGRGVGMDVVRRSVQALGGRITVVSQPGLGARFSLSLPLTLAVMEGMVVSVAGHTLIVPISAVVETLQPTASNIHGLGQQARLMALRGGFVPVLDVAMALGYRDTPYCGERSVALLVQSDGGARAVLLVDGIGGQRQVVIKSLEANYRAVAGIAAATVMGDGRVALILDVEALLGGESKEGQGLCPWTPLGNLSPDPTGQARRGPGVLDQRGLGTNSPAGSRGRAPGLLGPNHQAEFHVDR